MITVRKPRVRRAKDGTGEWVAERHGRITRHDTWCQAMTDSQRELTAMEQVAVIVSEMGVDAKVIRVVGRIRPTLPHEEP